MVLVTRRHWLSTAGTSVVTLGLAGCQRFARTGDLIIRNESKSEERLSIEIVAIDESGNSGFTPTTITVEGGISRRIRGVFEFTEPVTTYRVSYSMGSRSGEYEHEVRQTHDDLFLVIKEDKSVYFTPRNLPT